MIGTVRCAVARSTGRYCEPVARRPINGNGHLLRTLITGSLGWSGSDAAPPSNLRLLRRRKTVAVLHSRCIQRDCPENKLGREPRADRTLTLLDEVLQKLAGIGAASET